MEKRTLKKVKIYSAITLGILLISIFMITFFGGLSQITSYVIWENSALPRITPSDEIFIPQGHTKFVSSGTEVSCRTDSNRIESTSHHVIGTYNSRTGISTVDRRVASWIFYKTKYYNAGYVVGDLLFYYTDYDAIAQHSKNKFLVLGTSNEIRGTPSKNIVTKDNPVSCYEIVGSKRYVENIDISHVLSKTQFSDYDKGRGYNKLSVATICGTSRDNTFFHVSSFRSTASDNSYEGAYINGYCSEYQKTTYKVR